AVHGGGRSVLNARRPAGAADREIRAGGQSQDRQDARARGAGQVARPRRRGDRVIGRREVITLVGGVAAWPWRAHSSRRNTEKSSGYVASHEKKAGWQITGYY